MLSQRLSAKTIYFCCQYQDGLLDKTKLSAKKDCLLGGIIYTNGRHNDYLLGRTVVDDTMIVRKASRCVPIGGKDCVLGKTVIFRAYTQ